MLNNKIYLVVYFILIFVSLQTNTNSYEAIEILEDNILKSYHTCAQRERDNQLFLLFQRSYSRYYCKNIKINCVYYKIYCEIIILIKQKELK